jgi:hypothetical protein
VLEFGVQMRIDLVNQDGAFDSLKVAGFAEIASIRVADHRKE